MSVQPTIAVQQPVRRTTWIVAGIAAVAVAGALVAVLAFSFGGRSSQGAARVTPSTQEALEPSWLFSLTPMQLAAGALGSGYALPTAQHGPSVASVLASLDPQTRRYTQRIMALTFKQLAAGAAGQP